MLASRLGPLALAALLAAPLAAARADVLVVDDVHGPYTSINAAVTAAANGDTILVRSVDETGSWLVNGKSLVVVGDAPDGLPVPTGFATLRNLPAGGRLVVRGFSLLDADTFLPASGLTVLDCAGTVWIEDCVAEGSKDSSSSLMGVCGPQQAGPAGLHVQDSARVVVMRSMLTGGEGASPGFLPPSLLLPPTDGGAGLLAKDASVAVHGCSLQGGAGGGGPTTCVDGVFFGNGGAGIQVSDGTVLVTGSVATGGMLQEGGEGAGLWIVDGVSHVQTLASTFTASGAGPDVVDAGSVLETLVGDARTFAIDAPLGEGEAGTLTLTAPAGELAGFFWSFQGGTVPLPAKLGWFSLDPALLQGPFLLGPLPGGGSWSVPFTAPTLVGGLDAQTFLLQGVFQTPGGLRLGTTTSFTLHAAGI